MWNALLSVSFKNSEHFWEEDGRLLIFSIQEDFEINQESNFHTISSLADVRGSSPDLVELELIRPCKIWKILQSYHTKVEPNNYSKHLRHICLPRHIRLLHFLYSVRSPLHFLPPFWGLGFVQVRYRDWILVRPHFLLQRLQWVHAEKLPCIAKSEESVRSVKSELEICPGLQYYLMMYPCYICDVC